MAIAVGEKYNIKSTMLASLLSPWKKSRWKSFTQLVVSEHWLIHIRQSAGEKSSLKYLNTDHFSFKSAHHLWPNYGCSSRKRVAASFRAKFITGSYILQTNRARFNQNAVDPTCPLCHLAEEDLPHLLFNCPALQGQRDKLLTRIKKLMLTLGLVIHQDPYKLCNSILNTVHPRDCVICGGKKRQIRCKCTILNETVNDLLLNLHNTRTRLTNKQ